MNALFLKLLNMSISASWLVLAVVLLRLVLKKAPKWVSVLLWGMVAIRLICPFSFESALSLVPPSVSSGSLVAEWADDLVTDSGFIDEDTLHFDSVPDGTTQPLTPPTDYKDYHIYEIQEPARVSNTVVPVLSLVWGIGILLLLLYAAFSYLRVRRRVRTAVRLQGNIYQSEQVDSPFVMGLLFPRIYLPFSMDGQTLSHVTAHENAHIRRKDHWWKPLGFLLLTLHWFNPLMWLAYILLCRDIELACDEKVIKELGCDQRADYTQALLSCSVSRKSIAACPLAFGEVGVKERVKSIMKYKKPAFWIIVAALIICAAAAVCFLTDPVQDAPGEPQSGEVSPSQRIDEALQKKIRKAMYLPDSQVLTYAGEYSQEPYTLLWVCYEIDGTKNYEAVSCEQSATGELKFKDICHVTTYTADIFHTFWMGEDIYLVNNPNCKQIINRSGDFRQEVPIDEDEYPYIYRALPMESPWMLIFADANGNDLYQPDTPIVEFDFLAEVLEIHEDYLVVKPGDGWSGFKPAMMEVPITERNLGASPKPQVGDTLIISTDGTVQKIYPPRLTYVSRIRVVEIPDMGIPRMIRFNAVVYSDTGIKAESVHNTEDDILLVDSVVDTDKIPQDNNQANFGTAQGTAFRPGSKEGTIEVEIDGTWWIFAWEGVWLDLVSSHTGN